jgi:UDP-N-acetylglucosamine enolpyruvyl transferase
VILGVTGDPATVGQLVTRDGAPRVFLPGGTIGQADTTVRHIDHIERMGQRIEDRLKQVVVLKKGAVTAR